LSQRPAFAPCKERAAWSIGNCAADGVENGYAKDRN
jgi:hypothetical protein